MLPQVVTCMVKINGFAPKDVKKYKGTHPLSSSKRSFNFLTLYLDFTLTSNTVIMSDIQPRPPPGGGGGRGETIILA